VNVRRALVALAAAAALGGPSAAAAQTGADSLRESRQPLFTSRDAWTGLAVLGGTALLAATVDEPVARAVGDPAGRYHNETARSVAKRIKLVNERSLFAVSAGAWLVGLAADRSGPARFGLHAMEAIALTALVQTPVKSALGRSRPFVTREAGEYDAFDFHFGKGFSVPKYRSIPSLHTGGTMAFATVLSDELDRARPGQYRWVRPVLYTIAITPGFARIVTDKHWTSDILLGGASGYLVGRKVSRYTRTHPTNRVDRWLLRDSSLGADAHGAFTVGWSLATPF